MNLISIAVLGTPRRPAKPAAPAAEPGDGGAFGLALGLAISAPSRMPAAASGSKAGEAPVSDGTGPSVPSALDPATTPVARSPNATLAAGGEAAIDAQDGSSSGSGASQGGAVGSARSIEALTSEIMKATTVLGDAAWSAVAPMPRANDATLEEGDALASGIKHPGTALPAHILAAAGRGDIAHRPTAGSGPQGEHPDPNAGGQHGSRAERRNGADRDAAPAGPTPAAPSGPPESVAPILTAAAVRAQVPVDAGAALQAEPTHPTPSAADLTGGAASTRPRGADHVTVPLDGANGLEGRLRIALRGSALHATIVTPDRDAAARIGGAIGELHRALLERGFGDVRLAIQHAPAAAARESAKGSDSGDSRQQPFERHHSARDDERSRARNQEPRRRTPERQQQER